MKTSLERVTAGAVVLGLALLAEPAAAQPRVQRPARRPTPAPAAGEQVRIRKLQGLGTRSLVKTPEYRHSLSPGVNRPGDWVEVKLTFDTTPEWIDELTVQFFVLTETRLQGKPEYTLFRRTVRCTDVERGENHMVAVYLPPNIVRRRGMPVAVGAEVSIGGKPAAVEGDSEKTLKLQAEWWKSPVVTESKDVAIRDDALLAREQSPFALVAIDDYEGSR